ncbi:uncharacterized protein LOC108219077 isoform X2 [Daucus carota subsp. sativus]|uniref:uncharacterized protein LOC108219077 isoform X2 n=1 Tax=Daucus carota subsp. sativus TaxID=79200 RepID=UPI003082E351
MSIPQVTLSSGNVKSMPVLGLGTAAVPFPGPEIVVKVVLEAIELGYRCVAKCTQVQLPFSRLLQWTSADRDVESTILDEPNIRAGVPGAGLNPRSDNISGSDITKVGNMVQSPLAGQFCRGSTQPFQPSPSARRLSEVDLSGTYHAEFVIKYKQEFERDLDPQTYQVFYRNKRLASEVVQKTCPYNF